MFSSCILSEHRAEIVLFLWQISWIIIIVTNLVVPGAAKHVKLTKYMYKLNSMNHESVVLRSLFIDTDKGCQTCRSDPGKSTAVNPKVLIQSAKSSIWTSVNISESLRNSQENNWNVSDARIICFRNNCAHGGSMLGFLC